MAFQYGISADSAVRTSYKPLAPWNIYDVKFKGCEVKEFDGKKDPTAHYKVLAINFEGEEGVFTVTQFFPKAGDDERRKVTGKNGGVVLMPSNFETCMAVVKQTAQTLCPAGFEKMQAASSSFKSFDDVVKALISITNKVKDTEIKIKLIGRKRDNKIVADIPRIVGINKEGDSFIADNYIGSKLFFTEYEETERAKYLNTKPTDMKVVERKEVDSLNIDNSTGDDLDLSDLTDDLPF